MNKIIVAILVLFTAVSFGQQKQDWERIKTLKIAFLTEKLDLSSKEAQDFWPVYNAYDKKREALRRNEQREIRRKIRSVEDLTDQEAKELLAQHIGFEKEKEKLNEAFIKEISTVISAKKTLLLLRSEEDFKRQLLKQYRRNRGGR